jgi:hypothetical protein
MSSSKVALALILGLTLGLFLDILLGCKTQSADAEENTKGFLYGAAQQIDPGNAPSRLPEPYLWNLGEEKPLPDYIVKRYVEPLVWVKIPKGFAGVWETRGWYAVNTERDWNVSQGSETTETTVIRNGKVVHHKKETRQKNIASKQETSGIDGYYSRPQFTNLWDSRDKMNSDDYRFVRGMQIDENGDIWDCPSIRNVQFHKRVCQSTLIQDVVLYTNENQKVVSDSVISESLAQVENSEMESKQTPIFIQRRLVSASQVDQICRPSGYVVPDDWHIIENKIADFKPLDSWRGIDLKASFNEFRKRTPKLPEPANAGS